MAISRAQLAAALVEYDNEEAPLTQRKNHRQSALFTHLQPRSPPAPQLPPVQASHPVRPESSFSRHSFALDRDQAFRQTRRKSSRLSSSSYEPLPETTEEPPIPDVSLDRWDLPSHLVSTSPPPASGSRTISRLGHISTGSVSTPVPPAQYSPAAARAVSIHLDHPNPQSLDPVRPSLDGGTRRRTISFDLHEQTDTRRRTQSSTGQYGVEAALAQAERVRNLADQPRSRSVMGFDGPGLWELERRVDEPRMIPLPSSPGSIRGRSFDFDRAGSCLEVRSVRGLESVLDLNQEEEEGEEEESDIPNPFALPAPPPTQASRFDPKFAQSELSLNHPSEQIRPVSQYTQHRSSSSSYSPSRKSFSQYTTHPHPSQPEQEEDLDGFTTLSRPTYDDIPSPTEFGKPLIPPKYRRLPPNNRSSLLRPKTLIMPQSLTMAELSRIPPKVHGEREGWVLGEKPLPREASSSILSLGRGTAGRGKEFGMGLAGELRVMQEVEEERARLEQEERERRERANERPPGRLYGTSLMDQLEARKQYTKNKQRVFTGDSRPTMFARPTLPTSESATSSLVQTQTYTPSLHPTSPGKKQSRGPLLQFDPNNPETLAYNPAVTPDKGEEGMGASGNTLRVEAGRGRPGLSNSRSVFGVDELWEKEMKKLALIQAEEETKRLQAQARVEAEAEILAQREREKEGKKRGWLGRNKGKEGKGKGKEWDIGMEMDQYERVAMGDEQYIGSGEEISPISKKVQDLPPMLEYSPEKPPDPILHHSRNLNGHGNGIVDDEFVGGEDEEEKKGKVMMADGSDSSDEDDIPLSRIVPGRPYPHIIAEGEESDSEEDVPLSRIAPRPTFISTASTLDTPPPPPPPPLVLNSDVSGSLGLSVPALPPSISPRPPTIPPLDVNPSIIPTSININQDPDANANANGDSDDEDDDKPLALRIPTTSISQLGVPRTQAEKEEIEDDLPLGFKHPTAVQSRQVSGSASTYGYPQQSQQQQQQWGIPYSGSMYGMGMPGMPGMQGMQGMGYPGGGGWGYGGSMMPPMGYAPPMGMGMGMSPSTSMPYMGLQGVPHVPGLVPAGLGPNELGQGPGGNIDSWRKGVRAPSTVNGESGA